jgi:hypothetical protein
MSLDGTYGFVYCGVTGLGIGVIVVSGSAIVGSDYSGGRYLGTLIENEAGDVEFSVDFHVAAGTTVVQGTAEQDIPYVRPLRHVFGPRTFGDEAPFQISVPPGEVTVMMKQIPDEFAPAATNGFTIEIARLISR